VPVYDSIISRTDAAALIPEDQAAEVISAATQQSAALQLCRRYPMSSKVSKVPVTSALAQAYWVQGDTGLKQTSESAWAGLNLEAEEIAAIVPVPEAVVDDADHDIWGELRPQLAEAVAERLDGAVFGGGPRPASWPTAIIPAAIAAGNVVELGTSTAAQGGVVGDLGLALDAIETDGFDASAIAAERSVRGLLRKARDTSGQLLADLASGSVWGLGISYVLPGVFPAPAKALVGDFSMAMLGVRQDLTYKLLDQAVITDDSGAIVHNLAQQDMLALRVTARFAFVTANPMTRSGGAGFPFSVVQDATS
jgi:HK97 family phage major capsid protein